jgi:alkylated DNA repair dioxygenase AlkB
MKSLFPLETESIDLPKIPGLGYLPNYISKAEEAALIAAIDAAAWNTSWQRRRQLYGASYGRAEGEPRTMPAWSTKLAERMFAEGITTRSFDQLLVNEYQPGQGISMHCDYETFDDTVVSLSLLSPCVMDFRNPQGNRRESLLLEPRSLLVLSGPARYEWQHGIAARKSDVWQGMKIPRSRRISVTFRSVK